jgi:methylated-DNA-protein-cysteine methyltransferase related protein
MWSGPPVLPRQLGEQGNPKVRVRPVTVQDSSQMRDKVLARVRSVPRGRVTTYGDLWPGAPRAAGAVLAGNDDPDLPWQRIVRADGSLPKGERQKALLEQEGVPFRGQRVDMASAWVPV